MSEGHKRQRSQVHKGVQALVTCVVVSCALINCAMVSQVFAQPADDAVAIVIDALKGEDEAMQSVAIALARDIPGEEVTKALAKELGNLSPRAQVQLLSALGDRGDKAALPAVVTATKSKDESVRITALRAVGELGDARSVGLLAEAAAKSRGAEQKAAQESLYRLSGPEVNKAVLAEIESAESAVKVELVRAAGERNITAGVPTLLKTAQDANAKVQYESFKVLQSLADFKQLPKLVELLISVKNATVRKEAERTVVAVSGSIGHAKAVLTALPSVKDVKARCSLLNVLGRVGDSNALSVLREALKDGNADVRAATIRALSEWPSPESADNAMVSLLRVAETSDDRIHRILAVRGFVRLIGVINRPAADKVKMCKQAMSLAPSVNEKRGVLSALANVKSYGALKMAADYLEDKDLQQEAEVAVVRVAGGTAGNHPAETKAMLQKVIRSSKNESVRKQAQQVIDKMEQSKVKAKD